MALPQGGFTLGRRPLGETLGRLAPCLGPPNGLPHGGPLGVTLLFYFFINFFLILAPFLDIRCIVFYEKNPEYKLYSGIVRFLLHSLGVNLIRRDKKMRFSYFSYILTLISYMY
jgi:hypothetical protein